MLSRSLKSKLTLGQKMTLAATGAVVLSVGACAITVYELSARNRVSELRTQMSGIIGQSESVAEGMDAMYSNHAFDTVGLSRTAQTQAMGKPLREMYASTALYQTIPIVAAWQSVKREARDHGFEFFTPSRPGLAARNPKNDNGADFAEAFKAFALGEKEYFFEDKKNQQLVLARPVVLRESCLGCHGDPARSATKDGCDMLGFPMENLKLGDIKGAFVLQAPMTNDAMIAGTVKTMALVGAGVLVFVLSGTIIFIRGQVVKPLSQVIQHLNGVTGQVTSAAAEVAAGSQSLAEGASEQAASLEETSASLEEVSSMIRRTAQNASQATESTSLARRATEAGVHGAKDVESAMDGIKAASQEMRETMHGIKAASANVSKIIKTIDEIAFQTNILALNAAVEAARAGEAGMGFAVVADEVRNLAQRSAKAARETADMIESSIKRGEAGVLAADKVTLAVEEVASQSGHLQAKLAEILTHTQQVDEQVANIAQASQEQSTGITQVSTAVSQMDKVTQTNAASAEESASAAEELSAQAISLRQSLNELKQIVGGEAEQVAPAAAQIRVHGPSSPALATGHGRKRPVHPRAAHARNANGYRRLAESPGATGDRSF